MSTPDRVHDRQNVELKAKLSHMGNAVATCSRIGAADRGLLVQTDTYFHVQHGRLKLRETAGLSSELIWYERPDKVDARASRYQLVPVPDPAALKAALSGALGVRCTVKKHRRLFLFENVRIHLDDVDGLGTFIEFEAVCGADEVEQDQYPKLVRLREAFTISPTDEISSSYGDLLEM